jgi:gluconate 2-dehydrogenase gamma chain
MTADNRLSRRRFLQATSAMTGATFLRLGVPALIAITESACTAKQESAAFVVLTAREAADFAAIAARIIPTTDTPGATEAGVIYFIDNAFAAEMRPQLDAARAGLAAFNAGLANAHPDIDQLASLPEIKQDAYLTKVEDGLFFNMVRQMTIFGMFAMSQYGGNKDDIGWKLLNFDGSHGGWQYPFGHYDAEVHGGDYHGE